MSDEKKAKRSVAERHDELIAVRDSAVNYAKALYEADPSLSFSYLTGGWTSRGETCPREEVLTQIGGQMPAVSERLVKYALLQLEKEEANKHVERRCVRSRQLGAAPGQEDDTYLRRWYKALTGREGYSLEVEADLWAMKRWMWQVLRNAQRLDVQWQVVPSIWSRRQGTGKSYLVDKLTAAWKTDTLTIRAYQLSQDFFAPVLSRTLIAVLDEFAGVGEGEEKLAVWKAYVTSAKVMRRQMYENTCFEAANRMSMIATSNLPPEQQLKDSSGGRRMWYIQASEIGIQTDPDRAELARDLDAGNLWRAVDPSIENIQAVTPAEVRSYMDQQQHHEARDEGPLEGWLRDWTRPSPGHDLSMRADGRDSLNRYASKMGYRRPKGGSRELYRAFKSIGVEAKQPGGDLRLIGRRLAENEPSSHSLHVVPRSAL